MISNKACMMTNHYPGCIKDVLSQIYLLLLMVFENWRKLVLKIYLKYYLILSYYCLIILLQEEELRLVLGKTKMEEVEHRLIV